MLLTTTSFSDFELIEPILKAIVEENYTTPTPIQAATIPHLLAGRDLLGCSQTGTGKTAAFALPILQRLDANRRAAAPNAPRVLVVSPTRELAAQISDSFSTYGRHLRFRQAVIFGGVGQAPQTRALARGVHIVVATPGRLLDLMEQGFIKLDRLEMFVVDEADRMLDLGFLPDLKKIIAALPKERQSIFFSATMPPKVAELAAGLLSDPVRVDATPPSSTVQRIDQNIMNVGQTHKRTLLERLLQKPALKRVLVFTRTKRRADIVAEQLCNAGIRADAIHGNKSQVARTRILLAFRNAKLRVLVATDLAARGIDIDDITHVINYDLPHEPESYVHRIGRTGRAGATGIAISFCDMTERTMLRDIERLIQKSIDVDADHPYHVDYKSAPGSKGAPRPQPKGDRNPRNRRRFARQIT